MTRLVEQWVTRAAAKQRRGRAGRTKPGFCYKLYTKIQEGKMGAFPIPEIKRVALESVSLAVKVMHDDVKVCHVMCARARAKPCFLQNFLSRAIDPPDISAIDDALATLTNLGAISEEGELTPLGQNLVCLSCSHFICSMAYICKGYAPRRLALRQDVNLWIGLSLLGTYSDSGRVSIIQTTFHESH
jgi:HrpA-like RNA helicase